MQRFFMFLCVLVSVATNSVFAQPRAIGVAKPTVPVVQSPIATIQKSFLATVNSQKWSDAKKQEVISAFNNLPQGMQEAVAASWDSKLAAQLAMPAVKLTDQIRGPIVPFQPLRISRVWPESGDGSPLSWLLVYGQGINQNCQIWFNNIARTTYYMPWGEDFGVCVGCQIPIVPVAQSYDLYVKDTSANKTSNHLSYRVVAPRGWRGNHGWQFRNFTESTIPWECFRHYFGANEVEDRSGNHLPAAQAWYDSTYKNVGAGGNCFGMTLAAERFFFWQPWCLYESWWVANRLPRAWDYTLVNEVRRTINEHQGAQLEASIMANKLSLLENQDNNQAWQRCRDLIGRAGSTDNPLLSIYGPGWGHCVWPYSTDEVDNTRRIHIYDNNVPYSENEPMNSTTIVQIDKTTGQVTWNGANRIICRSYADTTPADPHLPTEATNGEAALMTTVVVEKPATVSQIRDENGRTFYVNGVINENKTTRIPNSMLFVPDTGTTPDPNFPLVYVFGNSKGKSFQIETSGVRGKRVWSFNPGIVFEVRPEAEQAVLTFEKVLTNQVRLDSKLNGTGQIRIIMKVAQQHERVMNLRILESAENIRLIPSADKSSVTVENPSGRQIRFELEVQAFQNGTIRTLSLPPQTLASQTGALLSPEWTRVQEVQLEMKNLQTGVRIRSEVLRAR